MFINKTLPTETAYQQDVINRDRLSTWLIHILHKPHLLSQDDFESAPPHLTYQTTDADRDYVAREDKQHPVQVSRVSFGLSLYEKELVDFAVGQYAREGASPDGAN